MKQAALDPLYVIFEQHLYNFQDSEADRKHFIYQVVQDYLTYLRRKNISVPKSLESLIVEELALQVNTMLTKKIYGCLTMNEYAQNLPKAHKKRAKARYSRLNSR